jgi:hypothetical protein
MWYMYSTSGQLILPIPLDDVMFTGIEVTMEMFYAVVVVWVCSLARPMTSVLGVTVVLCRCEFVAYV